ncbi:DUF3606 domain-containing protein [Variovorax sp. LjRoot178]|uniref:DUF3606 domain-containing protein n=1 Tax=Variovorax sp. LjRoot178 TaxID=3342277 RepID=UPI003ECE3C8B
MSTHEVRYWMAALGVDEKTLRQAVAVVGVSAAAVRDHLGIGRLTTCKRPL